MFTHSHKSNNKANEQQSLGQQAAKKRKNDTTFKLFLSFAIYLISRFFIEVGGSYYVANYLRASRILFGH